MSVEPLVFIPVDKWSELKTVLKSDWPRSILGLLVLENQEILLKSGINYGFKVYCPFGDINYGMVALNIKNTYHEIIVQCPKDDTRKLEEALKTTNIIDWRKCNQIPALPTHVTDCVYRLYSEKNLKIDPVKNVTKANTYVLDKDAPLYDARLPPGFYFEFLTLDSVTLVNETWPHKYPGSEWLFEFLIKSKLGYGLYNGKELLAWVFLRDIGALGHLYTLENHRRKGYGGLVLKLISNIHLKEKKYTVAYCAAYNTNAGSMYKKLGFKNLITLNWIDGL
ncbi:uncharacterized protein LOC123875511 [Maniola jurtina]|uniref:uncharacterized protein LOC123875511 n=1 Tax=Maniola jurtina TaxID=191418 RepID=UPI001E6868D1|nr:uncharacterized protein LOC123875511 [Maniola jurtina]